MNPQPTAVLSRGRIWSEISIVLALSLGASAVYSVVSITERLTRAVPLSEQSTTINRSLSERPNFDLIYQLLGIAFDLAPVALVMFLLWNTARPRLGRLGIDFTRPVRDGLSGLGLAVIVGVPGIILYLVGRNLGFGVPVNAAGLTDYWWVIPVLLLSALRAGLTEEIIVVGYLYARLRDLGWGRWQIILSTAVLRGTYHLYQGVGAFVGNVAMGVLFGWIYTRYGRVLPLVIAHTVIDAVVFVGYRWAAGTYPELFGVTE
ncbi:CPBP family intramembrane glutamic endopeptidase [Rhodoglobus sp. NPDC076762]